jgi:deoxyribodipyrimidine photo-lyase
MRTLVWFRGKDLRIADHAPLREALAQGEIVPLFVLQPRYFAGERARELPHRIQFLLDALRALAADIAARGSRLIVVQGKSAELVPQLARAWRVDRVVAHRTIEPFGRARDARVAASLHVPLQLFEGETLHPPGTLRSGAGTPFSVYTAFARAFAATASIDDPLPVPRRFPPLPSDVHAREVAIPTCEQIGIARNPSVLRAGEAAARARLTAFLAGPARAYATARDRMDQAGTSRLSCDLKFGTLSVRSVWRAAEQALRGRAPDAWGAFHNELVWREFTHSTLWDRPELLSQPFRPGFRGFPWRNDARGWRAWVEGKTGYPIVDAAARQLLGEGFVHNRARMISASFLCKHLLIDYRRGEAHYMKYLTDGDWANNNAGWQWSAGSGCDAQPYFRIFNPVTQGTKFDPDGEYVRRWVPELARMPSRYIHRPWQAPEQVLSAAGVKLGKTYPKPIVDHAVARRRFLLVAEGHLGRKRA